MIEVTDSYAEVLQNKITKEINSRREKRSHFFGRIENEGNLMKDFIAPLGLGGNVSFYSNGTLKANVMPANKSQNSELYSLHPHAIRQAGEKLGIPTGYIHDLGTASDKWKRDLAAQMLNEHTLHSARKRVLLRSVDGQIRGVLSDSYRRLNTPSIYGQFIQAVHSAGAMLYDAYSTDTKSWIEAILPELVPVQTKNNGTVYLAFGSRISSSDFGDGALELRSFVMQAICLNGMVSQTALKQIHLGSKIPDDMQVSEKTYKLDTETQASLVNDFVGQMFNKNVIVEKGQQIQLASETMVDFDKEIKKLPAMGMLKNEVKDVQSVLLANNPDDGIAGGSSLWKLAQAISAVGRNGEESRKRDIDEIAGRLVLK
jgi:hypothetical protein